MSFAVTALGISELLSEISAGMEASTLYSFIFVNHLFFFAGIQHLWRHQRSLVPLLTVLLPPNVSALLLNLTPLPDLFHSGSTSLTSQVFLTI